MDFSRDENKRLGTIEDRGLDFIRGVPSPATREKVADRPDEGLGNGHNYPKFTKRRRPHPALRATFSRQEREMGRACGCCFRFIRANQQESVLHSRMAVARRRSHRLEKGRTNAFARRERS